MMNEKYFLPVIKTALDIFQLITQTLKTITALKADKLEDVIINPF